MVDTCVVVRDVDFGFEGSTLVDGYLAYHAYLHIMNFIQGRSSVKLERSSKEYGRLLNEMMGTYKRSSARGFGGALKLHRTAAKSGCLLGSQLFPPRLKLQKCTTCLSNG